MKKVFIALSVLTTLTWSCKDTPKTETSTTVTNPSVPEVKKDNVATAKPAANILTKDQIKGIWRSTIDKKNVIQLEDALQKYTALYDGKIVEAGTWDVPTDCKNCGEGTEGGCFRLKANGDNMCCIVMHLTADTLQYVVPYTTGKVQSFVREKK